MTHEQAPVRRQYRVKLWNKIFAVLAVMFCVGFLGMFVHDALRANDRQNNFLLLAIMATTAFSIFNAARMFMSAVSFTQDCIEVAGVLQIRVLPLAAICGRREYIRYGSRSRTQYSVLASSDERYPSVEFAKNLFEFDATYWAWYEGLADLDAEDERRWQESKVARV